MTLPTDPQLRKAIPIYSGFIKYFPRTICAVAELSRIGNDQHNPGKPLHWDRSKSGDEKDALMRHLIDQTIEGDNATDTDNVLHATKKAWRAMADLEKILEKRSATADGKVTVNAQGGIAISSINADAAVNTIDEAAEWVKQHAPIIGVEYAHNRQPVMPKELRQNDWVSVTYLNGCVGFAKAVNIDWSEVKSWTLAR